MLKSYVGDDRAMGVKTPLENHPNLSERTYQIIKDEILHGNLTPGSRIVIVDTASRLGVSRTPVTDALNRLVAEGFVSDVPRKGYFVALLNAEDIADLMYASLVVQVAAAERGIRHCEQALMAQMQHSIAEMEQLIDDAGRCIDYPRFVDLDREFHRILVSSAGSRRLVEVYLSLNTHAQIWRIRFTDVLRDARVLRVIGEHKAILDAFAVGDLPALRLAMTEHLEQSERSLVEAASGLGGEGPAARTGGRL